VDITKVEGGFVKMTLNITPLGDRVVVEPLEKEDTTPSGLVLPETAKEKPQEGTVLAAGPGRVSDDGTRVAMDVKVGDRVLYARYAGTEFKPNDKKVLILGEKDILAIIQ
jgi:chaperonin GroES